MEWIVPIAAGAGVVAMLAGFVMVNIASTVDETNTGFGVAFVGLLVVALCFIVAPITL
ncbi:MULTISPECIES: hypothetical protein [unclassified Bradyrhizobium]|uniref:hypothetical protein n=1 Tax=Bradyrhizobium sp. USDA 4541 TaxID=2817704 RepID=UPI0020A55190|nr:hypothetical protein [Bradyrhizobium sp. USDA 4541]MCP1852766.1 hypothetical protein [Bradyrhizobium sp. USDA 4541]